MTGTTRRSAVQRVALAAYEGERRVGRRDDVVTEEPLQIRIAAGVERQTLATTMRTPGHDFELAAGWLHAEGLVTDTAGPERIDYCTDLDEDADQEFNTVTVWLPTDSLVGAVGSVADGSVAGPPHLHRTTVSTSSCGVCGRDEITDLVARCRVVPTDAFPHLALTTLYGIPASVRATQQVFARTGGLHGAAAWDVDGRVRLVREDIGRHNAVDKVVGRLLLDKLLPASDVALFVSGRTSFEIVQKAAMAGFPVIASVSAPSSLAVDLADELGITLIGFLRGERANVYSHAWRIDG